MNTPSTVRTLQNTLFRDWQRAGAGTTLIIVGMLILSQVIFQAYAAQGSNNEQVIATAARQATLGQQIATYALILGDGKPDLNNRDQQNQGNLLNTTVQTWQADYHLLVTPGSALSEKNTPEITHLYQQAAPAYNAILGAAQCLADLYGQSPSPTSCTADRSTYIQTILKNEPEYLQRQTEILKAYQDAAATARLSLSRAQLIVTAAQIIIIVLMGILILQPIIKRVQEMLTSVAKSEEHFRVLTGRATDMLAELDLDGNFVYVSWST